MWLNLFIVVITLDLIMVPVLRFARYKEALPTFCIIPLHISKQKKANNWNTRPNEEEKKIKYRKHSECGYNNCGTSRRNEYNTTYHYTYLSNATSTSFYYTDAFCNNDYGSAG